jgi:hypothetical protein
MENSRSSAVENSAEATAEVDLEEANRQSANAIFSPLAPGFTRTVTILPADDTHAAVECVVTEANLSNPLEFKALSYTWGSKADLGMILLNRKPFLVTKCLLMALTQLREMGYTDPLWIDALCTMKMPSWLH